jgi:hypothetical protein
MSSQSRYAGDIIASFIVTGMKQRGGKNQVLIQPAQLGPCG